MLTIRMGSSHKESMSSHIGRELVNGWVSAWFPLCFLPTFLCFASFGRLYGVHWYLVWSVRGWNTVKHTSMHTHYACSLILITSHDAVLSRDNCCSSFSLLGDVTFLDHSRLRWYGGAVFALDDKLARATVIINIRWYLRMRVTDTVTTIFNNTIHNEACFILTASFVLRFLLLRRPFSVSPGENCLALIQRRMAHMKNITSSTSNTARTQLQLISILPGQDQVGKLHVCKIRCDRVRQSTDSHIKILIYSHTHVSVFE